MPAKDICHDAVKQALNKDGWTIPHDCKAHQLRLLVFDEEQEVITQWL